MSSLWTNLQNAYNRVDRAYKRGYNRALFSCERMTALTSEQRDRPLTRKERAKRALHLTMCSWCRRYNKQIDFLGRNAKNYGEKFPSSNHQKLSPDARQRIIENVRKKTSDSL